MISWDLQLLSMEATGGALLGLLVVVLVEGKRLGRSAWASYPLIAFGSGMFVTGIAGWLHHAMFVSMQRGSGVTMEEYVTTWGPGVEEVVKLVPVLMGLAFMRDTRMRLLAAFCVGLGFGAFESANYVEAAYGLGGYGAAARVPWLRVALPFQHGVLTAIAASGFVMLRARKIADAFLLTNLSFAVALHAFHNVMATRLAPDALAVTIGALATFGGAVGLRLVVKHHFQTAPAQDRFHSMLRTRMRTDLPGWIGPTILVVFLLALDQQPRDARILSSTDTFAIKAACFGLLFFTAFLGGARMFRDHSLQRDVLATLRRVDGEFLRVFLGPKVAADYEAAVARQDPCVAAQGIGRPAAVNPSASGFRRLQGRYEGLSGALTPWLSERQGFALEALQNRLGEAEPGSSPALILDEWFGLHESHADPSMSVLPDTLASMWLWPRKGCR